MKYEIKCSNCSAPIPVSEDRAVHFCPFCGASVKIDYDKYDFERFKLKHEEEVRRRKVQEKKEDDSRTLKTMILMILIMVGIAILTPYVLPR